MIILKKFLLLTLALGSIQAFAQTKKQNTSSKPNIIFILADDLGYGDVSCFGSQNIETPNIDALAAQGMRLTRFYAGSAVCSPSRASMLTGRYPLRFDIRRHFNDNDEHLPSGVVTLPHLLKKAGYTTAHIGKWHLGGLKETQVNNRSNGIKEIPGPLQHGFDYYLADIEDEIRAKLITERRLYRDGGQYLISNDKRMPTQEGHWDAIKMDELLRLMNQYHQEQKPFYINLWFDAPHTPYEPAPEPYLAQFKKMGATGDALYHHSMVYHMDAQIGRLLARVKQLGIADNTLIVFTSDNGPAWEGSPGPFKGGKTDLHEGGLRVPFIAVWPGKILPGKLSFQDGHIADLLPTFCEAVGISITKVPLDGISLLPVFTKNATLPERTLLWQMDVYKQLQRHYEKPKPYASTIAKHGKWKLLADGEVPVELFDLENDPMEIKNLLGSQPAIEAKLATAIKNFLQAPRQTRDE